MVSPLRRYHSNDGNRFATGPWRQSLARDEHFCRYLATGSRGLASRPQRSEVITTTTLSVAGGTMTVSLPLPGLPGLTVVSVPVDVPVRDLVKELMALDKR